MLEGCVGLPSHKDDDWPRLFVDVVFDYLVRSLQTKFMGIDGVAKAISQYLTTYEEQKLLMLLNSYAIGILVCLDGPYSGYPPYAEVDERMTLEPASQARILSIARTILETAYIHRGKRDIDNTIKSWIPLLAKTCYRLLARKPIPGWDSFLLDQQIYESLPLLLKLPQYVPEKIPMIPLIRATANQLLGLCSVFVTNYVHSGPDGSQIPTSTIAGKPAHLPDVMCPAFEFLSAAIRDKRPEIATYFANESHINDLITCVFQWSLLCRSDEYDFERHPERFVFPNEEQQRDSLRACASELLTVPRKPIPVHLLLVITASPSSSKPSLHQQQLMAVKELVDSAIADNTVIIFSKSWCPYCKKAKAVFRVELSRREAKDSRMDEGAQIQDYLAEKSGQRTVPNIFIKQQHIGGSSDLIALDSKGKLASML
ncbi:hypothetical protein EUX98_g3556 [Antrodiella citrinella]|uniref:Glutaredoxin domain-containing protein n=1 Tax=Antrodiella citrinella TaxID=2447956 RepID=A0A4V3XIV7_9APHY|nr:hypothetical protein EUX98_g3556 [Antrodiella citrinella]